MITVHHLENSRSQRILWLLEELRLDYQLCCYKRDPVTALAPAELREVHSLGKAPVVVDGDEALAESGAIIETLARRYGNGRLGPPEDRQAALDYLYWMHYAEGTFMPLMFVSLLLARIEGAKMPFFAKPIARGIAAKVRAGYLDDNVRRNLDHMESTLTSRTWFAGDAFSAADIQMSFAVEAAETRTRLPDEFPMLANFLAGIRSRPAYCRAIEKGGPYQLLDARPGHQE